MMKSDSFPVFDVRACACMAPSRRHAGHVTVVEDMKTFHTKAKPKFVAVAT